MVLPRWRRCGRRTGQQVGGLAVAGPGRIPAHARPAGRERAALCLRLGERRTAIRCAHGRSALGDAIFADINDATHHLARPSQPERIRRIRSNRVRLAARRIAAAGRADLHAGVHAWCIGQPHRIHALERILEHVHNHAGIWTATGAEILAVWQAPDGVRWQVSCCRKSPEARSNVCCHLISEFLGRGEDRASVVSLNNAKGRTYGEHVFGRQAAVLSRSRLSGRRSPAVAAARSHKKSPEKPMCSHGIVTLTFVRQPKVHDEFAAHIRLRFGRMSPAARR